MAGFANDYTDTLESKGQVLEFYGTFSGLQVSFKAFLTNYTDNIDCKWTPVPTFGRPDPIQTYSGTRRTISLSWSIPAFDVEDAKNNLIKTSTLARLFYPEYSTADNASTISKAPLIKIKFANLIYDASKGPGGDVRSSGLLGAASGMSWKPTLGLKGGFFDPDNQLYPKNIEISISNFAVLHQHPVGFEKLEAMPAGDEGPFGKKRDANEIQQIDDNRKEISDRSAPKWASEASLFPWSAGIQRANTNIGVGDDDAVGMANVMNVFKGKS